MKLPKGVTGEAYFSDDGQYRYVLRRWWNNAKSPVTFIMLNPSTAGATVDDMTLRKCEGFAQRWGFGSLIVVNLFALIATDPDELAHHDDPVGPENDRWLHNVLSHQWSSYVAAWGHKGGHQGRDQQVMEMVRQHGKMLWRIGPPTPLRSMPRHPGRISYELELQQHA